MPPPKTVTSRAGELQEAMTELIEGKTLREIAEMPMMEARKLMRESGHRWFGVEKDSEPKEEPTKARNVWIAYKDKII